MLFQFNTGDLSSAVAVLTAMITPAVLISACGTLILSTSTRLGRTVDRVRSLLEQLEALARGAHDLELFEERRKFIYEQLEITTRRNRLLQRGMQTFYSALGVFIATSVSIGFVAVTRRGFEWLPAALGLTGASFLFYGSILLIIETRIASNSVFREMDFSLRLSREFLPAGVIKDKKQSRASLLAPFLSLVRKRKIPKLKDSSSD